MNYYLAHGFYAPAFTGTVTNASSTVSGVSSTVGLVAGMVVSGNFITPGTTISSVGSGTLTLSANATGSASSQTMRAWPGSTAGVGIAGVAWEGDGLATGLGATPTPATVSIDLSAYTAAATNTVTVCGALLTCVASGATANQFNAGSGSTLATNLASAINAATNTVNAAAAGWLATVQLRNAIWASASGSTLTLQTRAASAVYNSNASWQVVSSGLSGGSQLSSQFAGGVSGPWGYFANDSNVYTIWPSAMTECVYSATNGQQIAGPIQTINDTVYIRANNAAVLHTTSTTLAISFVTGYYVVDNGTVWAGDTGTFTVTDNAPATKGLTLGVSNVANVKVYFGAIDKSKCILSAIGAGSFAFSCSAAFSSTALSLNVDNVTFNDSGTTSGTNTLIWNFNSPTTNSEFIISNCSYNNYKTTFYSPIVSSNGNSQSPVSFIVEGCSLNWFNFTGTPTGLFGLTFLTVASGDRAIFRNSTVTGLASTPPAFNGYPANAGANNFILAENLTGVAVNTNIGLLGVYGQSTGPEEPNILLQQSVGSTRQYRLESSRAVVSWNSGLNYPTLNSTLPDGTPWSYNILWAGSNLPNAARPFQNGLELARFTKSLISNSGLSGTVRLEMLFDPTTAALLTNAHIGIAVTYVDASTSVTKTVFSAVPAWKRLLGAAIPSSSASWTFSGGAYTTYVPLYIQVALPTLPKNNTEIELGLRVYQSNPTASTASFFINPDMVIG